MKYIWYLMSVIIRTTYADLEPRYMCHPYRHSTHQLNVDNSWRII